MAINNDPCWVEVEVEGEFTKEKYHGRFYIKPYLTNGERADAVRLAEKYCRGIDRSETQKMFLTTLAFLKLHVVDADAAWWQEDGLSMLDESPIYNLSGKLTEIQEKGKTPDAEKTEGSAEPESKK